MKIRAYFNGDWNTIDNVKEVVFGYNGGVYVKYTENGENKGVRFDYIHVSSVIA